ncbi:MAG: diacylglycerol kinase [Pirellulaceae bacterium]
MNPVRPRQTWGRKFQVAFRGIGVAMTTERSFRVHLPLALAVALLAAWFQIDPIRWCLLLLCVAGVLSAELLNSAIERLAQAIDAERVESDTIEPRDNARIRDSLDIASGGVLVFSILAAAVGLILFLPELLSAIGLA